MITTEMVESYTGEDARPMLKAVVIIDVEEYTDSLIKLGNEETLKKAVAEIFRDLRSST